MSGLGRKISRKKQEELLTLRTYLARDTLSRVGAATFALCFVGYLMGTVWVLACIAICWVSEIVQLRLLAKVSAEAGLSRREYFLFLFNGVVSTSAYALPAFWLWNAPDSTLKIAVLIYVTGGLLNITMVRASHIPLALANGAPLLLVVLYMARWLWDMGGEPVDGIMALGATFVVLAYFLTALRANHFVQARMGELQQKAEAREEAKSRFLARMSHEIRTTLNGISGVGQVLQQAPGLERHQAELDVLNQSAETLRHLVDDALDMDAVERGAIAVRPGPTYLTSELADSLAMFQAAMEAKALRPVLEVDPALPECVSCDRIRLRQVLGNLLANAVRHTQEGPIYLLARRAEGRGDEVEICISDSGPGIPLRNRPAIFNREQRPKLTRSGQSGLGLSISKAIAQAMGGDLALADPQPALGASFVFRFAAPVLERDAPRTLPPVPALPDLSGRRLLVVDDVSMNRFVLAAFLKPSKATIIEADSGAAALEVMCSEGADMVFVDLNMPKMDGYQTLAALREIRPDLPVIAVTAEVMHSDGAHPATDAFDHVLAKPLERDALCQVLCRHLAKSDALGAACL